MACDEFDTQRSSEERRDTKIGSSTYRSFNATTRLTADPA
jgi:hypothetical protein